jgi:hypothetical protein
VAGGLDMFRQGTIATGWRMIPSGNLSLTKRLDVWGLNPEGLVITLVDGLCDFGWNKFG